MPQKNKPRNPFEFLRECQPWREMRKAKKGTRNAKKVAQNPPLYAFLFSHFAPIFAYFGISVWSALQVFYILFKKLTIPCKFFKIFLKKILKFCYTYYILTLKILYILFQNLKSSVQKIYLKLKNFPPVFLNFSYFFEIY